MTLQFSTQRLLWHFPAALHAVVDVGGREYLRSANTVQGCVRGARGKRRRRPLHVRFPLFDPQSISGSARAFDRGCGRPAECTLKMI